LDAIVENAASVVIIRCPVIDNPRTSTTNKEHDGGTIGFTMKSPEQANAWHAAGVANGGSTCEDPPGLRSDGMYLAYLRDPDGNKLCAFARA